MKTKKRIIAGLLMLAPFWCFAQEWDDIYADPVQEQVIKKERTSQPQKKKIVVVQGSADNMFVRANGRDIDEYNRRHLRNSDTLYDNAEASNYKQYEYTDRIVRFHDPESSVKITGADEVTVYVGDDLYTEYYQSRGNNTNLYIGWGFNSYYPWYDSWYDPWYYSRWHSPWYYSRWYDPWYYHYAGWYSPWYYSRWYSPWYYGGWYDPWYYGYSYGGGYYHGYYDGYYSGLGHGSHAGRSSGTYRTSYANANRASTMNRYSSNRSTSYRSSGSYRNSASRSENSIRRVGTGSYDNVRRSGSSSRTRIIDNSGRTYDARTGRIIEGPSVNQTGRSSVRYNNQGTGTPMQRNSVYQRSNSSSHSRSYSAPLESRSSRTYSAPASSSNRSSSYSSPSRSSSTGSRSSSSFGSSSSSSRSSSSGSYRSSSGRSSGGRR